MQEYTFPKLHNAAWPGVVGKGPDSEPPIALETLLDLTEGAEVDGVTFDGIDLFLSDPHISIDSTEDDIKALADDIGQRDLEVGSLVAPIWPDIGGGSAMGSQEDRDNLVTQVEKSCKIGAVLREQGTRLQVVIRIDSSVDPGSWAENAKKNTELIAQTWRRACDVAAEYDEELAAEGEICWGGMHSWKAMVETLEAVDRPNIGFQADMAHTLLYLLGYNAPEDRILPEDFEWGDRETLEEGLEKMTEALRPWTIDFHVAQNDGTVFGSGTHDKTGRHCLPNDPEGRLDIAKDAGHWLRDENGELTKAFKHICWDGCMFPNEVMKKQQTWNNILTAMIYVREKYGWSD